MEDNAVNVRRYGSKATQTQSVAEFVDHILADIACNHVQLKQLNK